MSIVIINQAQVAKFLPMCECIEVMQEVLAALARGECQLPLRQIMWLPDKRGALGLMPSIWSSAGVIGLKAVTFFPGNEGTELDSHQGAVMLYDADRGTLLAVMDGTSITAVRTAAVSGVATKLLARDDCTHLAIIGSGVQAGVHLQAMLQCRSIERVTVFSKTYDRAKRFAESAAKRYAIPVEAVRSCKEAVIDADIICTTTSARDPVLQGNWLAPGTHINAVGSSVNSARELNGEALRRSKLYVDRRESALNEAGDFVLAKEEGVIDDDHIVGEIGDLLTASVEGRKSSTDITLFKSVGLAVEDLAAALHIYRKAKEAGAGTTVEFGGRRIESD